MRHPVKQIIDKMIAMIGSGSWATAIVKILLENNERELYWWTRSAAVCDGVVSTGHNPRHLSSLSLDAERIHPTTNLATAVAASDILFLAVPSVYLADTLAMLPADAYRGKRFVSAIKGYVPQHRQSVSQYLEHRLDISATDICVVSGPSHAEEVAESKDTFLTVASKNPLLANDVASSLRCNYIHTAISDEVDTIELCGLSKNVYAIAAGICYGLDYGDNFVAMLTTAAAHELQGLIPETTLAFRLLGDLIVTCFSHHSRNRALGEAIAHGITPEEHFRTTGMVAEGYYSAQIMHDMGASCPIPIAETVYDILYKGLPPSTGISNLINIIL